MKPISKFPSHSRGLPFSEPERPADVFTANVDGAARGNPGPASYAVIVRAPDGTKAFELGKYIGRTTNNVAEYYGLVAALDYATSSGIQRLRVISDSELMVRQMQGRYKVKSPELKPLHERAQKMARALTYFAIEHVRRERNSDADELANAALDRTSSSGAAASATSPKALSSSAPKVSSSWIPNASAGVTPSRDSSSSSSSRASSSSAAAKASPESPRTASSAARSSSSSPDEASGPIIANTPYMQAMSREGGSREPQAPREQTVRAHYKDGALHPLEDVELAEGETVEIRIRRK